MGIENGIVYLWYRLPVLIMVSGCAFRTLRLCTDKTMSVLFSSVNKNSYKKTVLTKKSARHVRFL